MSVGFRPVHTTLLNINVCYLCYVMCHTLHATKRMPGEETNSHMPRQKRRLRGNGRKSPLTEEGGCTRIRHQPQMQAPEVGDCPFPRPSPAQMAQGTPAWAPGPEGSPAALNLSPVQSRRGDKRTKTGNNHKARLLNSENTRELRGAGYLWDLQPPPPTTPHLGCVCRGGTKVQGVGRD